jgi:cation:H+ antiporter
MIDIAALLGGFALLIAGGELLVRGSVKAAMALGISRLLIGLTLVGFGTSMPELVTSVQAAIVNSPGIAVGNIVGSNIANILLILGLAALISPIAVSGPALRRDGTIVVLTAVAFAAVGLALPLDRPVGVALIVGMLAYMYYAYMQEASVSGHDHTAAFDKAVALDDAHKGGLMRDPSARRRRLPGDIVLPIVLALAGLVVVMLGARFLVFGATSLARHAGIPETIIGLTIVAIGTSLPELVTSVVAAVRKQGDVALGNILGSNIYNVLGIGGVTALISPTAIPAEIGYFDLPIMVVVSLIMVVFARTRYRIGRAEGAALATGYCAYVDALVLR